MGNFIFLLMVVMVIVVYIITRVRNNRRFKR